MVEVRRWQDLNGSMVFVVTSDIAHFGTAEALPRATVAAILEAVESLVLTPGEMFLGG